MRVLFDTDIALDLILRRDPFFEAARDLFELNARGAFDAYVSAITPVNVFYVARKIIGPVTARQAVGELLIAADVCPLGRAVLSDALASPFSDYEDAVQHACAAAAGLDAIVTRNSGDYKDAALPVFSPADFLKHLESRRP
jgi:predicted nucleic acid-binding protein